MDIPPYSIKKVHFIEYVFSLCYQMCEGGDSTPRLQCKFGLHQDVPGPVFLCDSTRSDGPCESFPHRSKTSLRFPECKTKFRPVNL